MRKGLFFVLLPAAFALTGCPVEPSETTAETPQQNPTQQQTNAGGPPGDPNLATPPTEGGDAGGPPSGYGGQLFKDLIKDDQSIDLTLNITGSSSFEMEFQICKETGGRKQPTVIHKEKSGSASITLKVPKNYENDVWLVMRHHENDEPGPNSLEAGVTEPIKFGEENISLDFTLTNQKVEEKNPCYSQGKEETPPQ